MSLLLDTHVFLWFVEEDPRLSSRTINDMKSPTAMVFVQRKEQKIFLSRGL